MSFSHVVRFVSISKLIAGNLVLGGSGLTLLLNNARHLLTLCLGTGVGSEALLQETKATLI